MTELTPLKQKITDLIVTKLKQFNFGEYDVKDEKSKRVYRIRISEETDLQAMYNLYCPELRIEGWDRKYNFDIICKYDKPQKQKKYPFYIYKAYEHTEGSIKPYGEINEGQYGLCWVTHYPSDVGEKKYLEQNIEYWNRINDEGTYRVDVLVADACHHCCNAITEFEYLETYEGFMEDFEEGGCICFTEKVE